MNTTPAATTSSAASSSAVKAALLAGAVCDLTPESDEGHFYLPDELVRDDIREGLPGVVLRLRFHVRGDVMDHRYVGGHISHTGQIFFTERLMKTVEQLKPYSESTTVRRHYDHDSIFHQAGGSASIAKTSPG